MLFGKTSHAFNKIFAIRIAMISVFQVHGPAITNTGQLIVFTALI